MGAAKTPKAPDPNKSYQQGVDVYLQNLPSLLNAEQDARAKYDDPSVEANLNRQETYGGRQIGDDLAQLQQIDPTGQAVRGQLGQTVTAGLANGTGLPTDFRTQLSQFQGAAADARGSGGTMAATPEDVFKGSDALAFYNARLGDTQKFLAGQSPEQQIQLLPQATPDRGADYVNMNAGTQGQQFALQNYNNQLAQSGSDMNWWQRALNGARIGGSQGSVGGPWGAIGGAAGGAFDGAVNGPIYKYQTGTG